MSRQKFSLHRTVHIDDRSKGHLGIQVLHYGTNGTDVDCTILLGNTIQQCI